MIIAITIPMINAKQNRPSIISISIFIVVGSF